METLPQSKIAGLLGPWVASTIASNLMTGVNLCQAVTYFSTFPTDRRRIRWSVIASVVLTGLSFCLDCIAIWEQTVPADSVAKLTQPLWSATANIVPIAIVACITQLFFSNHACAATGHKKSLTVMLYAMTAITLVIGLALVPIKLTVDNATFLLCLQAWLWMTCATDLTITITLSTSLKRKRAGFNLRTDALLRWLARSSVSTAACCAIVAVADASLALASTTNAHLPFTHFLPRVYVGSLLFVLNSRAELYWVPHASGLPDSRAPQPSSNFTNTKALQFPAAAQPPHLPSAPGGRGAMGPGAPEAALCPPISMRSLPRRGGSFGGKHARAFRFGTGLTAYGGSRLGDEPGPDEGVHVQTRVSVVLEPPIPTAGDAKTLSYSPYTIRSSSSLADDVEAHDAGMALGQSVAS